MAFIVIDLLSWIKILRIDMIMLHSSTIKVSAQVVTPPFDYGFNNKRDIVHNSHRSIISKKIDLISFQCNDPRSFEYTTSCHCRHYIKNIYKYIHSYIVIEAKYSHYQIHFKSLFLNITLVACY